MRRCPDTDIDPFLRLPVCKRVGISQAEVHERVGKSAI